MSGFYAYHKCFAGSDLHLLCGAERALDASSPKKLLPYPPELGKAIVDLYTKGNISVWDLSHSLVFSKLTNLLELDVGIFSRSPRSGGSLTEDKKGCGQEGIESYGQKKSDIA